MCIRDRAGGRAGRRHLGEHGALKVDEACAVGPQLLVDLLELGLLHARRRRCALAPCALRRLSHTRVA
eukprot:3506776-Prymnesium_polylepis.1